MKKLLNAVFILLGSIVLYKIWGKKFPDKKIPIPNFISRKLRIRRPSLKTFFEEKPETTIIVAVLIITMVFAGSFFEKYRFLFKASLLDLPKIEFIGTTSPVEKVPKWTELTEEERKMSFVQIPASKFMELPSYNIKKMQSGMTLKENNDLERNTYITYPVPNLGNYKLDGTENSGSHPGIDIKVPVGTPIHAIASGIVYKMERSNVGYGNYVSIAHPNVPSLEDPQKNETIFSTYAHLSQIFIEEGDMVKKGQIIGKSGDTGYATAPHLHFQIDKSDAPFIPYWPFSWSEMKNAGLSSFFDAVRQGLGKSNAQKYTIHPINFVAKFQNYKINEENLMVSAGTKTSNNAEVPEESKIIQKVTEPINPEKIELVETAPEKFEKTSEAGISKHDGTLTLEIKTDRGYTPGEAEIVEIQVNAISLVPENGIELSSTLKQNAIITPDRLTSDDFSDGMAKVLVKTSSQSPFKIIAEGEFGSVKSESLRPEVFKDISGNHEYANAVKFLKEKKVINGYADGTFRPDGNINRAEALKIILEVNEISAEKGEKMQFNDVDANIWFAKYIETAFQKNIVDGYSDGSFKPENPVSRAEFLKMAINTANFTPNENLMSDPYSDVDRGLWFAKYFQFAKEYNLLKLKKGGFVAPNVPITRGEAADVIYKLSQLEKR